MKFAEFHNGLRVLLNVDQHELVQAGILRSNDINGWGEFRRDPFRWFIRADDEKAKKLWALVKDRMGDR